MIRERVSAHPALEYLWRIRVLSYRTEVEHPVVLLVVVIEEFLRVFASVTVKSFNTSRGVPHDNHLVSDICQVCPPLSDVWFLIFDTILAYLAPDPTPHL